MYSRSCSHVMVMLALLVQLHAAPVTASPDPIPPVEIVGMTEHLPVGRFDARGIYHPPVRRSRFRALHSLSDASVPRHPIVLAHGIFGFERLRFGPFFGDYWVGVVKHLRRKGVRIFATEVTAFESIAVRAAELRLQVERILAETGAEKVNLVAHSMGGLDCRYLITHLGMADRVASLTTISTPHHGSWFADFFQDWVLDKQRFALIWDAFGIPRAAIPQCSVEYVNRHFNPSTPNMPQVRYFSLNGHQPAIRTPPVFSTGTLVCNLMEKIATGRRLDTGERIAARLLLPPELRQLVGKPGTGSRLGDSSWVIPELAGRNDSLVSLSSSRWGEPLGSLDADHLDQIGWFSGFDARRFYQGICTMLVDAGF